MEEVKKKRGRPPKGDRSMTAAERQAKRQAKLRAAALMVPNVSLGDEQVRTITASVRALFSIVNNVESYNKASLNMLDDALQYGTDDTSINIDSLRKQSVQISNHASVAKGNLTRILEALSLPVHQFDELMGRRI